MKEIIEMVQILSEMSEYKYMQCKCILMSVSREHQEENDFIKKLFHLTDSRRPLLIGMKKMVM